jgi:hypothetical protein
VKKISLLLAFLFLGAFAHAQSTSNNTSACSANGVPTAGCNGVGSMPFSTNPSNAGAETVVVDPLPGNVSSVNLHTLLYSGATTRIGCEYQPWFSNISPFNGHQNIGMEESNLPQVLYQLQTMKNQGCDVVVVDYYGTNSSQAYNLTVTENLIDEISANPSTTPKLMLMLDEGSVDGTGSGQCPPASGDQSACLEAAIDAQLDFVAAHWLGQSYYELNAKDSHPIVPYYIIQGNWPNTNFNTVYAAVAAHATAGQSCGSGCTYPATVDFVDENAGAFTESGIMGGFAWPQPQGWSPTSQFNWSGQVGTYNYVSGFYSAAQTQTASVPNTITMGGLWKGFDDHNASWGSNRVIAQQCGQVLNFTAAAIGLAGYSSSKQLQYLMVATWNDDEEGTEVEGGVFNCLPISQPAISGGNMTLSFAKTDATYANLDTVNKLQIWTGTSAPTTLYRDNISPTVTSSPAPTLGVGESAWWYAVGQPLIMNQLSPPVSATNAAPVFTSANNTSFSGSTPQTFSVTASGIPTPAFSETGTLPSGFTFTDNGNGSASLSGTPSAFNSGLYSLTLSASNGVSPTAYQTFTLTVNAAPVFTSASSVTFIEGVPSSFTVSAAGYPVPVITLPADGLPSGLSFVGGSGTGVISGTPTSTGTTSLSFTATNTFGVVNNGFSLTVAPPTAIGSSLYTLNAVQPPTTSSDTNYAAWESVLGVTAQNLFTGATAIVADGCSSGCSQTTYVDQGTSYPILSWTAEDALVATYTSQGKKANVIQAASIEGGENNGTSAYVYTQNWANLLDTDGSGQYRGPLWTSGQTYRTLQYVLENGVYWQMTATVTLPGNPGTATYGQGCIAGSTMPAFTGSGPYTESATYPCVWTKVGTSAPPQDVICSSNFAGVNCYSVAATQAQRSSNIATLTLTNNTFSAGNGNTVTVSLSDSTFNATNATIASVSSTGITYANSGANQSLESVTGTVKGSHSLNINTQNATTAILASGLPVAYELPYSTWRNYFCDQAIQHYNAGQLGGGYIVCGYEGGGEYSTFDTAQQPSYTKALFLSGINDLLISESNQNPTMPLFGDMNAVGGDYTYTDQEAAMEVGVPACIGLRTNGLEVTDITDIICSQGVSSAYCSAISTPIPCDDPPVSATLGCTSGGWYRNKVTYPTCSNGSPSKLSLQTLTGTTPTNAQVSSANPVTGPISSCAASADCPQGFIGLLPALVALRTTGLVNFDSGPTVTVNNAEIYTSGPASCGNNCTVYDSSAYPVGDMLFALDPSYSSTTYAQATASVLAQVVPYDAAFALFLGTPSIYGACPTSGGSLCSSATWSLGVAPPSPNFYAAYTGAAMVPWSTVPSFGNLVKNNAVAYDTSYALPPASFVGAPSPVIRCTDSTFEAGHPNASISAGLGGSGDAEQLWNSNSTALHLNDSGGRGLITSFNKFNLAVGCGTAVTAAQNLTNPGASTVAYNFTGGTWDWSNPDLYYGFGGNEDTTATQAMTYDFNLSTMNFTVGPMFTDFQYALPLGTNAPAWAPSTPYTQGQYVSYTLTSSDCSAAGAGCDWASNHLYSTLGTIIVPTVNNPLGCAFKLTVAGTSAVSPEPTWSTSAEGTCLPASNGQIADGTAKWRNLGGGATFAFQLTSASGTSGSTTPAFVPPLTGRPDLLGGPGINGVASDNGLTWTNSGPTVPPAWQSFAGISRNSTRMCSVFSSNSYGYANNYTTYNEGQGTGIYAACYDNSINKYILLNHATGYQSVATCVGGTGYNCSGGSWTLTPQGAVLGFGGPGCGMFSHNMKQSGTMDYPVLARQAVINSGGCPTSANDLYEWQPFAPFNPSTSVQLYNTISNHWAMLDNTLVNVGAQTTGPPDDFTTGPFTKVLSVLTPAATPLVSWQPTCTNDYSVPPPSALPPCNFGLGYDSHMSPAYNPGGLDNGFICGSIYNYADLASPPEAPWQGEEVCISVSPTWADGATPNPAQTQYRFTHAWNTGGNSDFNIQFAISQLSGDGQFLAFGSDGNCQFGGLNGTTNPPCGPPWAPKTAYTTNGYINPFSTTNGTGTNFGVWQITVPGTSAATAPIWSSCNSVPGCFVADANGVQYTYVGANESAGAVLIVQLVPVVH